MEPLDTEVKGDPDSFTALCTWLRRTSANAEEAEEGFQKSQTTSEAGGWVGEAGDAFRGIAEQGATASLDAVQAVSGACSAMEIHADDLRTVRSKMQRAREVAAEGGLTINAHEIMPPGPAPKAPGELPDDATAQQRSGSRRGEAGRSGLRAQGQGLRGRRRAGRAGAGEGGRVAARRDPIGVQRAGSDQGDTVAGRCRCW